MRAQVAREVAGACLVLSQQRSRVLWQLLAAPRLLAALLAGLLPPLVVVLLLRQLWWLLQVWGAAGPSAGCGCRCLRGRWTGSAQHTGTAVQGLTPGCASQAVPLLQRSAQRRASWHPVCRIASLHLAGPADARWQGSGSPNIAWGQVRGPAPRQRSDGAACAAHLRLQLAGLGGVLLRAPGRCAQVFHADLSLRNGPIDCGG